MYGNNFHKFRHFEHGPPECIADLDDYLARTWIGGCVLESVSESMRFDILSQIVVCRINSEANTWPWSTAGSNGEHLIKEKCL